MEGSCATSSSSRPWWSCAPFSARGSPTYQGGSRQVKLISVADVLYFQSDTKYTRVVLAGSEAFIRTPLKDLLPDLDADRFWQVHRGTIVNVDAVSGVLRENAERQFVLLKGRQERLPIARQFFHLFKQM
jgi:DNA-binding LytR/AlgR family response regulator